MDANQLPPEFETIDTEPGEDSKAVEGKSDSFATDSADLPNIPGYRSIRLLGRGGMGIVILAEDLTLGRKVAIKLVSHDLSGTASLRDRFEAEVKTLASLQHQNIAQLYSAGSSSESPFFVMEYVEGTTLDFYAREPLNAVASATLLETLCEAIDYCHSQGVLHRDLKPSNILMAKNDTPKIADFGLAKALGTDTSSTKTGEVLGTPGFMSPEQAGGIVKNIGVTCDVYGLGAILYRLLTGRAPFVAVEPFQAIIMVLSDDPVRPRKLIPNIPVDVETICLKCLEKKPDNRYQSAKELQADLRRFLNGESILARPAGPIKRILKWARRNLSATISIMAVVVLITAGVVGLLIHNATLAKELNRSKRLADHGSMFAKWITEDHLKSLNEIAGTTKARTHLVNEVNKFLEDSYADMPIDPIYTLRLGYSYAQLAANIGGIRKNTIGDLEQAESNYQRAIELYDKTLETTDDRESVLRLKADAMLELSDVQLKLGKSELQSESLKTAQTLADSLDDATRGKFLKLQVAGRLVEKAMERNQHQQALKLLEDIDKQIEHLESGEDYRAEMMNERILSAIKKGVCEENLGNVKDAEVHLAEAVRLSRQSAEADGKNVKEKIRLASALTRLADLFFWQQKYDQAKTIYEESLAVSEMLASKDEDSVDAKIELAVKLSHIAGLYQNMSLLADAQKAVNRAISIQNSLIENGNKDVTVFEGRLINIQSLATICAMMGKPDESQKHFALHYSICEAELKKDSNNVFVLNQIAENRLTQSLMILGAWASQPAHDPESVEESPELKKIDKFLKESLTYFDRIKEIVPLNAKQQSQVEQIEKIKLVIIDAVQQIKAAASSDSGKVEAADDTKEDSTKGDGPNGGLGKDENGKSKPPEK